MIKNKRHPQTTVQPPKAKKIPKKLTIHGDTRIDNYYWLNQRNDPEVLDYLNAENDYREKMTAHLREFQAGLFKEITGRIKQTDMSVPYKDNGYFYYSRYEEGKEHPIYCRKKETLESEEIILLNVNDLAQPYKYYKTGGLSVSLDNRILAYGEDTVSRRIYTLRFKDLKTGKNLSDTITNTSGNAIWANDNKTVFYTVKDDALRPFRVMRHVLGTSEKEDVIVYEEKDETFTVDVFKTKSDKYIIIGAYQTVSTEYRILDADNPHNEFSVIQPRERDLEYSIAHFNDKFFILTNWKAKNFRLMETNINETSKIHWKEVIPHRTNVLLEDMDIFNDFLVLTERIDGISKIRIMPWTGEDHYIDFGEDAYLSYTTDNYQYDTDILRIGFTSMTTPNTIYDYDMRTRKKTLLKRQEVIGDFSPDNYQSQRLMATARDGVKVPISLVYKKGTKLDGSSPLLLYGYGSYGYSMDPYFSSVRLSLLDRGFIYAIAHVRGGEELGREWYDNGRLLKKKNTFYDFIDCAEYLISHKFTSKGHLFAMGGSAGGLLMGAVINMRPDLWKGVVAAVPFVDVVTTMLDESIPLTTGEFDEWGNPKDKKYYDYIKSYSPIDNVEAKDYPALLVTTGLHDSQVQYWEPAKWVAKLRDLKTGNNPLFLYIDMDTGHGGAAGRFEQYKDTAMEYTFLLDMANKIREKK